MTALEWDDFRGRLGDGGVHIEKAGDARAYWSLSAEELPIGLWERDLTGRFATLRAARAAVVHMEVVRLRRIKQARHLFLTAAFSALAVSAYQIMALPTQWYRVEWFAIATVATIVALSECLGAFLMVIDDGWDYRYEVPPITIVDLLIARVLLRYPVPGPTVIDRETTRVRVVGLGNPDGGPWSG